MTLNLQLDYNKGIEQLTTSTYFIIDRLPQLSNVYVAAGFSGHGFKYCSVVGEILASMVENQRLDYDIDMFGLDRLIS